MKFPEVDRRPDVWDVNISQPNLLYILNVKKFSGPKKKYYTYESDSESSKNDSDSIDVEYGQDIDNLTGVDTHDIKCLLLTTQWCISIEIVFLLLCSKRTEKWKSTTVESLLEDVLCSPECIFRELTSYEIDGILRILQRYSSKKCPLFVHPKMKKLTKANFLAHLLGHYYRYIPQHKRSKELQSLAALSRAEVV